MTDIAATPLPADVERALETLRAQYFALVPAFMLRVPAVLPSGSGRWLVVEVVQSALPAPEEGYRRSFWRRVLPALEAGADDDGVDEEIYEAVAECMAAPSQSEYGPHADADERADCRPPPSFKTFIYPDGHVTLREEQVVVQAGTTGLRTWTAALHLAHHVLTDPNALFGPGSLPPVIELGAGTGFLSILLAQRGADVIATDLDDSSGEDGPENTNTDAEGVRRTPLASLRANLALNDLARPPRVAALDWADADSAHWPRIWDDAIVPVSGRERVVVAADVIYDPDIVPLLVRAIAALTPRSFAIVAATVRNEATFALFRDECERLGLRTELLSLNPMDLAAPTFWDTALDAGTRVEIVRVSPTQP